MTNSAAIAPVRIGPSLKQSYPLAFGAYTYGRSQWDDAEDNNLYEAMESSLTSGITHFDTASDYGDGRSERRLGRFINAEPGRRDRVFVASKYQSDEMTAQEMLTAVDASRDRLKVDMIDLYYIHWPRAGKDVRPWMEGLETARRQGKITAIGVSNFSVADMERVSEVGHIDAHQMPYNLIWRFAEHDIIPYCREHNIAVVTYSSLAHGTLIGNFQRDQTFPDGDIRRNIVLFRPEVWPHVYQAVEDFKSVAQAAGRTLFETSIRWLLRQPHVTTAVVGAQNAAQAASNAKALEGAIADQVFDQLTAISDRLLQQIPNTENPFGHHP